MSFVKQLSGLMEFTTMYRLWQAPFVKAKLDPVLRQEAYFNARKVLDVGCGPGTNFSYFAGAQYVGIDINKKYVDYACRKYGPHFEVQDVRTYTPDASAKKDFVLLNSLLHHLDDQDTHRILEQVAGILDENGSVHIVELVLPERSGIPRWMALSDRGNYPRSVATWKELFGTYFTPVCFEEYSLKLLGLELWKLVYFYGKAAS